MWLLCEFLVPFPYFKNKRTNTNTLDNSVFYPGFTGKQNQEKGWCFDVYFEGASQSREGEGNEDDNIAGWCVNTLASAPNKSRGCVDDILHLVRGNKRILNRWPRSAWFVVYSGQNREAKERLHCRENMERNLSAKFLSSVFPWWTCTPWYRIHFIF